jgi:hypothetical protein
MKKRSSSGAIFTRRRAVVKGNRAIFSLLPSEWLRVPPWSDFGATSEGWASRWAQRFAQAAEHPAWLFGGVIALLTGTLVQESLVAQIFILKA